MSKVIIEKCKDIYLDTIMKEIASARRFLAFNHVDQWQGNEPSIETIRENIRLEKFYIYKKQIDESIIGGCSMHEDDVAYHQLLEGAWSEVNSKVILHHVFISEAYRGMGYGKQMFVAIEKLCRQKSIKAIQLDTHPYNKVMKGLLLNLGYRCIGKVNLPHAGLRDAYEKRL